MPGTFSPPGFSFPNVGITGDVTLLSWKDGTSNELKVGGNEMKVSRPSLPPPPPDIAEGKEESRLPLWPGRSWVW